MAQENQLEALDDRKSLLKWEDSWQNASSHLYQTVVKYTPNVDLVAYAHYRDMYFDGWQEFVSSDAYPEGRERADDYMEENVRIVIWHVLERLIESGVFSQLHLSSPFRLGYQFHEEELRVLYMLNWPTISTSEDKQ